MSETDTDSQEAPKKSVEIPGVIKVKELAESLDLPVTEIIRALLKNGVLATINDSVDFDTAAVIADDFGFEAVASDTAGDEVAEEDTEEGEVKERAPIVTVMGHVDHGKTSLLDYIRKTKVTEKESGGITQHIGSYQVEYNGKPITFLDTPGHEAFSAIRAQGTKVTDVVVLVVAADDGVKPQTVEAIELAQAAGVPIIVAVTKIDRPEANIERAKQQLGEHNILTESWGGKVPLVAVSSKTGEGIDDLLEMIALTSEVAELKSRFTGKARGIIIEAEHDAKVGQSATVIVTAGALKVGDNFVSGGVYGKVKSMQDHAGKRIAEALPSTPVRITGFSDQPQVGDELRVVASDKEARNLASKNRVSSVRRTQAVSSTLEALSDQIKSRQAKALHVVIKADVQGSLQAIRGQLEQIKTDRGGTIQIIGEGVGSINESDVLTAAGGGAFVVGFKVKALPSALQMAEKEGIKVLTYDVIYELTDDLTKLLLESVGLQRTETEEASGEVLKVFRSTQKDKILGVKISKGTATKDHLMRVYREDELVGEGEIQAIKHVAEDVTEASQGDFGFLASIQPKVKVGDQVKFIKVEHIKAKIIK